jgi:hypothetical protein
LDFAVTFGQISQFMNLTLATLWMLLATVIAGLTWVRVGQRPGYRMKPLGGAISVLVMLVSGLLVTTGFFRTNLQEQPRAVALALLALLVIALALAYKPLRGLFLRTPLFVLVAAQTFRLPVELALHELWHDGLFPQRATFAGYNFDILTGATAPLMALLVRKPSRLTHALLVVWNLAGIALLLVVVTLAVLSVPSPFQQFTDEPQNRAVLLLPYIWLPTFLVPTAFILHWYSLRRLFRKSA